MLDLRNILLPVDYPNAGLGVLHQAAVLARTFGSEIVLLHVVTAQSHAAGVPTDSREEPNWDLLAAIIRDACKQGDDTLTAALQGITVRRLLLDGDPPAAIVRSAEEQNAGLIMMPSHGFTFDQFLLGAVTARVLHRTDCPVWTGAHVDQPQWRDFSIRNVLCAVDFGLRCEKTTLWAADLANKFGARLTLSHVTPSVEMWGPGGMYIDQEWKNALVDNANRQMAQLQQSTGVKADVLIGSGDVPKILSQAAKQTKADVLVTGCYPYGGHLRTHGYGIICAVSIPVVNV